MNPAILEALGFHDEVELVKEKKCPICKVKIVMSDFKDDLSLKEYKISGLCQKCQNKIFK